MGVTLTQPVEKRRAALESAHKIRVKSGHRFDVMLVESAWSSF